MKSVVAEGIKKNYKDVQALKGLSFDVDQGEIFGIIGPDGAGKTSLFRILTSLILPTEGQAWVDGFDVINQPKEVREIIGYMPGKFSLYQDLTVEENLRFFARVFNTTIKENYNLVKDIYSQIEPFKNRRAGKLSGGMKQKLALCCALIHKPTVLFLDEPTTGVDPVSRKEFWQTLARLKKEGISVLVSTPYMDEASQCDRIALIQKGSFLQIDTPKNIISQFGEVLWAVETNKMSKLLIDLRNFEGVKSCFAFGEFHHITIDPSISMDKLRAYLIENDHQDIEIKTVTPSIEDCYMKFEDQ